MGNFWQQLGFGARLSLMIISLVLAAVLSVATLVYIEYRSTSTEAALNRLQGTAEGGQQSFMDWLLARQDELQLYAGLNAFVGNDAAQIEDLLVQLAAADGFWDTIYVVDRDGTGQHGVTYDGSARALTADEARTFQVADRDWFQEAIRGNEVFSEPLLSRATGHRVSTVVTPIYRDGEIIAVLRGAVMLDTIFQRVQQLPVSADADVFIVGRDRTPITTSRTVRSLEQRLTTDAARAIENTHDGVGVYRNAQGEPVVGAYNYIDLLGWGLVIEEPLQVALAAVTRMFWTIVVFVLLIVAVAVFVCIKIAHGVIRTIGGEPSYASQVVADVADGDLSADIRLHKGDDSSLLFSIATMQRRLREIMADISSYAEQVALASTELSQVSESTEQGISAQSEQLNAAAVAINEMSATAEEVARNTQDAADAAKAASNESSSGQAVVEESIETVTALSSDMTRSSQVVSELKQDSDSIGKVLDVIGQIAEQTNLLALNAAIEAARAGESGRGFSVVADEVRTLASRTQSSTQEIQTIIQTLQNRADEAVRSMQSSSQHVEEAVDKVSRAGGALANIAVAATQINDMIQQIASATEEQTVAAREINQSIHSVSEISEQSASHVKDSVESSESLAQLAEHLQSLVKRFKF